MTVPAYGGEVSAFRYGLLSSALSREVNKYLQDEPASENSTALLGRGIKLIDEILRAQELVSSRSDLQPGAATKPFDLDAYRCALHLIQGHQEEFGVHTRQDLEGLFSSIRETLVHLSAGQADRQRAVESRVFFKRLAELMVNELSTSDSPKKQLLPAF